MQAVRRQASALGHSKTLFARAHSFLGYVFFVVFVIQIMLGFQRPLNMRFRKMAIFQHWLLGTVLNYGGRKLQLKKRIAHYPDLFLI